MPERIPEPCYARKETVNIDTLITSRDGDKKSVQFVRITRITSGTPLRMREQSQFYEFR